MDLISHQSAAHPSPSIVPSQHAHYCAAVKQQEFLNHNCVWRSEGRSAASLTASTSAGSYQTLMYGCCKASSTDILLAGSMTSIFDKRSLAWLAGTRKAEKHSISTKQPLPPEEG